MSCERAQELADQFQRAHQEIVDLFAACPAARWQRICEAENDITAALVNHIALGYPFEIDLMRFALDGSACPEVYLSEENLNQWHAQSSNLCAGRTKAETEGDIRQKGAEAADFLYRFSDSDLRKPVAALLLMHWYGDPPAVEVIVRDFLIGHHAMHLGSLKNAVFEDCPDFSGRRKDPGFHPSHRFKSGQ